MIEITYFGQRVIKKRREGWPNTCAFIFFWGKVAEFRQIGIKRELPRANGAESNALHGW